MMRERCHGVGGFSLVELLIVMAIISILAGTLIMSVTIYGKTAKEAKIRATIAELETHLEQYNSEKQRYPQSSQLVIELEKPDRKGVPYYEFRADSLADAAARYTPVRIMDPGTGTMTTLPVPDAKFVLDAFGRPVYYVPKAEYDVLGIAAWNDENGNSVADANETYYQPGTYQIWSAGHDGIVRGVERGGRLIPALMPQMDNRDNDLDGLFDLDDTAKGSKGRPVPQNLPEDDVMRGG